MRVTTEVTRNLATFGRFGLCPVFLCMGNTRLREDTGINRMGQKDPEKLYWERNFRCVGSWDLL